MAKDRFAVTTHDNGLLGTLNPFGSRFETTIRDRETGKSYTGTSEKDQKTATDRAQQELTVNRNNR